MTSSRKSRKVFCIGWHKTGTTTIGSALLQLGFSVLGCRLDMVHPLRSGNLEIPLSLAGEFDAVQDVPWACLYKELDQRYPNSLFILTIRGESDWLSSAKRHFGSMDIPLHEWIYGKGVLIGNESLYVERFRKHQSGVLKYFKNRPDDLLIFDLTQGDGWDKLCNFLSINKPSTKFPHENKAPENRNTREKAISWLREHTPRAVRSVVFEMKLFFRKFAGLPDPRNRFNNFRENRRERRSWRGY